MFLLVGASVTDWNVVEDEKSSLLAWSSSMWTEMLVAVLIHRNYIVCLPA